MLVGPNGAVVFEPRLRAIHMANVYDFYKPNLSSEYSIVDGQVSIMCYLRALDRCFQLYTEKASKQSVNAGIDTFDGILFHSSYSKLVQKSFSRLFLLNYLQTSGDQSNGCYKSLETYK